MIKFLAILRIRIKIELKLIKNYFKYYIYINIIWYKLIKIILKINFQKNKKIKNRIFMHLIQVKRKLLIKIKNNSKIKYN